MDPLPILAALGVADATSCVPVSGGWDTALWKVERDGQAFALRVFREEQADSCRREVRAMRLAAREGISVPEVHAEGAWNGRPALLLSWCPGQPLLNQVKSSPWRAWALGVEFGRMQARIHRVRFPEVEAGEPDVWIRWVGPDEAALQSRLRTLALTTDALLHLDYHPLNVMADAGRVTAVLDWANAGAGDPRADLARTFTILRVMPTPPGAPPLITPLLRRILVRAWRAGYEQIAGPVGDLGPFYAWAGAVMVRDLAPKLGRPGVWLEQRHLDRVARWTAAWKRRVGLTGAGWPEAM